MSKSSTATAAGIGFFRNTGIALIALTAITGWMILTLTIMAVSRPMQFDPRSVGTGPALGAHLTPIDLSGR